MQDLILHRHADRAVPVLAWRRVLAGALVVLVLFIASMELRLAARGFSASINDSESLWIEARDKASHLGDRSLVLIGGSRIQLGLDLDQLRRETALEPVQLAIDGSSFIPVLDGLAADPAIRGTVLVEYADHLVLAAMNGRDNASAYQEAFERSRRHSGWPDGAMFEAHVASRLKDSLRGFADGARPIDSLMKRILVPRPTQPYLVMRRNRSRKADYSKVPMPDFYYARVVRNLGEPLTLPADATYQDIDRYLEERISRLRPAPTAQLGPGIRHVREAVRRIAARGGRVIFVVLPTSGYVKAINDRRYPRKLFWEVFASSIGTQTLHFEDESSLRGFTCPDGSHLDQRDRTRFTSLLVAALGS